MAITATDVTLVLQKWRRDFWMEYQRENLFAAYIGNGTDAVIQRINELKDEGEQITIPLVGRLTSSGQVGSNTLIGNEEAMDQYGFKLTIDWARNAILLNKKSMRQSAMDQLSAVRPLLMTWATSKLRDDIVKALDAISVVGTSPPLNGNVQGIPLSTATAAQKNGWMDANNDRILFGASSANYVAGNFAGSLLNVDTTNDLASAANIVNLKRKAKKADPHIRPLRVEDGREYFVAFMGSNNFADFGNDASVISANTNARAREGKGMDKNPIFQDGDLLYKGIIAREIPEMDAICKIAGAGAGATDVYPVFLCGQQAVGYAVGQLPAPTERKEDDYGFQKGRGVETCYAVGKVNKNRVGGLTNVDWGISTGFYATVSS